MRVSNRTHRQATSAALHDIAELQRLAQLLVVTLLRHDLLHERAATTGENGRPAGLTLADAPPSIAILSRGFWGRLRWLVRGR